MCKKYEKDYVIVLTGLCNWFDKTVEEPQCLDHNDIHYFSHQNITARPMIGRRNIERNLWNVMDWNLFPHISTTA